MDVLPVPVPEMMRDWSELPVDALSVVFAKLGTVDVLRGAGLVCHSWLNAAKMPHLWRFVDMTSFGALAFRDRDVLYCPMAMVAVDRSVGQLQVFKGKDFVTDELLMYIGDRSPSLKVLSIPYCYHRTRLSFKGLTYLAKKCPQLEEIVFGGVVTLRDCWSKKPLLVLAELHQLRQLTLVGIPISKDELMAILEGCSHLELLNLTKCSFDFHVDDALLAKCSGIRKLELPDYYFDYADDEPLTRHDADFDDYYSD